MLGDGRIPKEFKDLGLGFGGFRRAIKARSARLGSGFGIRRAKITLFFASSSHESCAPPATTFDRQRCCPPNAVELSASVTVNCLAFPSPLKVAAHGVRHRDVGGSKFST
ncbi:hypothetical protein BHM03_00040982 [Ensete ventricosum]|nr:hypothetical protein BHM03_00040982 [Ensete ventricosum]